MRRRTASSIRFYRYFFLGVAVIIASFFFWESQIRPAAREIAEQYTVRAAQQAMNQGVSQYLASGTGTLLEIQSDSEDIVRSVETNMAEVNRIKIGVTESLLENLSTMQQQTAKIPMGMLLGSQLFAGMGPDLSCRFYSEGSFTVQIESRFEAAGINQTRYQLMLCVKTDMTALLAGSKIQVTVPTEYLLAETILAGDIPEGYTQVLTSEEELISKVNDYQAG